MSQIEVYNTLKTVFGPLPTGNRNIGGVVLMPGVNKVDAELLQTIATLKTGAGKVVRDAFERGDLTLKKPNGAAAIDTLAAALAARKAHEKNAASAQPQGDDDEA
jgi:hypothetical protein